MAVNLGGLPPVDSNGGFDLDSIIKIATLFNQMSEQQALYGTPGTTRRGTPEVPFSPGTPASGGELLTEAPRFNAVRRFFGGGVAPVRGIENVPSDLSVAQPGALQKLLSGGTAFVRGSTPGTPATPFQPATPDVITPGTLGLKEQAIRGGLAEQGLLNPEAVFRRELKPGDFTKKAGKREVFYNAYEGMIADKEQLAGVDTKKQGQYYAMDQEKALEEVGKFWRARISAGGQGRGDLLRLYSELNDIRPSRRTFGQKATLQALDDVIPEVLGQKVAVDLKKQFMRDNMADYKASKNNALSAINAIRASALTRSEKQTRAKGVLKKFKETYEEEDFYDLGTKEERDILKGL